MLKQLIFLNKSAITENTVGLGVFQSKSLKKYHLEQSFLLTNSIKKKDTSWGSEDAVF